MSDAITPFSVAFAQNDLDDLQARLARTRWPDPETCAGWDQGLPLAYARELADYWASDYDWRRCETLLNGWRQYRTAIDDLDIHFIHLKSPHAGALPLIISHGWPDSVLGFRKVLDALVNPTAHGGDAGDAFHVIVPSLPGYGLSGKPTTTGTSVERIGRMWGTLMARLGYARYVAQGGDWGSAITLSIAQTETAHCAGVHVTLPLAAPDPETLGSPLPQELAALAAAQYYQQWDSGYSKQQSTRPQTLAYALADSPVGQMSWIVEKFYGWTDCERDGVQHPENILTRDELLDNVTLYWLTNSAGSSARLYWESFNTTPSNPVAIPVGCSMFPKEIFGCSRRWAEKRFSNLIHWRELDRGGHFAAMEQPELFVRELRDCFRQLR